MADTTPSFKLFFGDEDNNVSSFKLGREAGFERFKELLQSLYPRYEPATNALQYLGADGLKVSFTNEEEYEQMLVRCRDYSLVKLYVAGRIDKSELEPVYPFYYPYWHDAHAWYWGGWGFSRRFYHALQNLWLGNSIHSGVPFWLDGAVTLLGEDYDVNMNALVEALKKQTEECLRSKDTNSLQRAKNILATHLMIEQGDTNVLFDLARVDALLGNYTSALKWLKKAANAGFNDIDRTESESDLTSLHGEAAWESILTAIRNNKGPTKKSEPIPTGPSGHFVFKFGSPDATQEKNKKLATPAPTKQEASVPKPAGGFLFSLPGSQPEKPKEEKPAPTVAPTGFLFSLPGTSQPEHKPVEEKKSQSNSLETKYAEQLEVLHSMGFCDNSLLFGFLEKFNGDVDAILAELLG